MQEEEIKKKARLKAGISQMRTFGSNQYLLWRVAAVKSMKKILLNMDDFYSDLISDIEMPGESEQDIVNNQIRNGWLYEAVSQAVQAIEDVFSMLRNANDLTYFAKNVVNYQAGHVTNYIKNFKANDIEYVLKQFGIPYFPLDEPWDELEIYEYYKKSVLMMSQYLGEMQVFHKKYYQDYCQYKHGMAVALRPFGRDHMKDEEEWKLQLKEKPLEGALLTFDNLSVGNRQRKSGNLPQLALYLTEDVQPFVKEFEKEDNLLSYSIHCVDIEEVITVTEHAANLLMIIWQNLNSMGDRTENDRVMECYFPTEKIGQSYLIGFPIDSD